MIQVKKKSRFVPFVSKKPDLPQHYPSMTSAQRRKVREQYVSDQQNRCHHCRRKFDDPPSFSDVRIIWRLFPGGKEGFLRHPIHLHHDHKTGMTIGAVHAICNAILWQIHGE